jgi:hypothetical protein
MPDFPGQFRRRNGHDRALGMSYAAAAHLAADHPGQSPATPSTHDQQVTRAAGKTDQDPASRAPLHVRLHQRIVRDLSPDRDERITEPPAGGLSPFLTQITGRLNPIGAFTARRPPGDNGHQGRLMGAGQDLAVAQGPKAARRAARPDD